MVLQRALTIAAIFVSVLAGRGEEPLRASAQSPETGSISEAKKSFENLRDTKNAKIESTLNTPAGLSVPELSVTAGEPKPARRAQNLAPQKSKNWLVDGVLGSAKTSSGDLGPSRNKVGTKEPVAADPDASNPHEGRVGLSPGMDPERGSARLSTQARDNERRPLSQTPAMNPFGEFMHSWISSQDRQLLLPGESTGSAAGSAPPRDSKLSLSIAGPAYTPEEGRASGPKIPVRDNPYIVGESSISETRFGQVLAHGPSLPAETVLKPQVSPLQIPGEAARAAPNKPAAREFGKQDDNGKYFRQLNRF